MDIGSYRALDGLGLADLIRKREISAAEATAAARAAIAAFNPRINAVAAQFEPPAALGDDGLFQGVPFLLKDVGTSVTGVTRDCGSRLGAGIADMGDSSLGRRFRAAGFSIIGRTTSPEMAFNITTENLLHGPTRNPWDLTRSAGGSSGGAAAAVAAGLVPVAEANDGGGSIRIPAACCGVVGLKPSRGRVSMAPGAWEYLCGLSAPLVVSRTVRDTAAALDIAQGAEPGDPYPVAAPARPYLEDMTRPPERLRIALGLTTWSGGAVDPACAAAAQDIARLCVDLGHEVTEDVPSLGVSWEAFISANARIWCAAIAGWVDGLAAATGRTASSDTLEATTLACWRYGRSLTAADLLAAIDICNRVSRSVGGFHTRYDIFLTPTLPQPPQPLGTFDANRPDLDGLAWTRFILDATPFTPFCNVTGQPAISLPLGWTSQGLPIGLQFAAGMGREDLLLRLAATLEAARPWAARYDNLTIPQAA